VRAGRRVWKPATATGPVSSPTSWDLRTGLQLFVPAEVAHFKNDPVGRMRTFAKEPGRENVEAVSVDLMAMPEATQPADVLWLHLFYHDLHTALI
jgi:predicted methyltransferase